MRNAENRGVRNNHHLFPISIHGEGGIENHRILHRFGDGNFDIIRKQAIYRRSENFGDEFFGIVVPGIDEG